MISVVIPTLNAEECLASTLAALVPATVDDLVREVIVADGGSTDRTLHRGCRRSRDRPLRGGAGEAADGGREKARFPWLLFLHADTALEPGWHAEAKSFIDTVEAQRASPAAAAFGFRSMTRGLHLE